MHSHYDRVKMAKVTEVDKFEEQMPNLANSSSCIEISNYISRQSTQRGEAMFGDEGLAIADANNKSMGDVLAG